MASTRLTDCVTRLADLFLEVRDQYEAANPGCALVVTCTKRSAEEQLALFKIGRYQLPDGTWMPDDDIETGIVTELDGYRKKSKHNLEPACAVDFDIRTHGKTSQAIADYIVVGSLAQRLGLIWGGTWGAPATPEEIQKRMRAKRFIDGHHLELA